MASAVAYSNTVPTRAARSGLDCYGKWALRGLPAALLVELWYRPISRQPCAVAQRRSLFSTYRLATIHAQEMVDLRPGLVDVFADRAIWGVCNRTLRVANIDVGMLEKR